MDTKRLPEVLGFSPETSIEEGLKETWAWLRPDASSPRPATWANRFFNSTETTLSGDRAMVLELQESKFLQV